MTDINSFNPDDIPASKKIRGVVAGDINVGKKSPQELEQSHIESELQEQVAYTDSLFNLHQLDEESKKQLMTFARMYYERRRITAPTIEALFQYQFEEIMRNMQRDYDTYVMDKKLEELTMRQFGIMPEDLEKFKF